MNLNGNPLRISTISDIHLGHRRNDARSIIANLNKCFSNEEHLSKIDMLVLVGDVFDSLFYLSNEYIGDIDLWIAKLLRMCYNYNVVVRVLEGTPSHDRNQSERFKIINNIHRAKSGKAVDLQYVETLSIEYIERFDINVLYIPDEINHDTDTTFQQVTELMKSKGIDKVDFAFMHGLFTYQIGNVVKEHILHKEENYLNIVSKLIFIGHDHSHSNYERIYVQGSFDRLSHGEEEPKGYLTAIVNTDNSYELTFVENKTARKFITVICNKIDQEDNLKIIEKAVKALPSESFVRVESHYQNPIVSNVDVFKRRWPLLNWSVLAKKDKEDEVIVATEECTYEPILINKDTLLPLVMDRIKKLDVSSDIVDRCLLHLKDLT